MDRLELAGVDHQDPDPGGTDVIHLGHVQHQGMFARPHALGQRPPDVVAPDRIQATLQLEFDIVGGGRTSDFHGGGSV